MQQWIIPCNIKLYDVIGAFNKLKCLDWRQSNRSISVGDEIFIYVGKHICSILFKCKVNRANYKDAKIDDHEFEIKSVTCSDNNHQSKVNSNYRQLDLDGLLLE